jgi:uncharacterized membrane protein YkvI
MNKIGLSLKIAAVFIGTVVGAGLASGQEIIQFFTVYGKNGIPGIILCGILYAVIGMLTVDMSYRCNAASYRDLIYLSCGRYLGWVVDALTTLFLFGGTCIILAGSGSIFKEFLGLPFITGILVMGLVTAAVVFNSTEGLIFINSIIVPFMIVIILIISYIVISGVPSASASVASSPMIRKDWLSSTLVYTAFNLLCATGVLSPMTRDIKKSKAVFAGAALGALGLLVLTLLINIVLTLNQPEALKYSIPMLYVAGTLGKGLGFALSIAIWLEMFSTIVSDVYSIAKKMKASFNLDYNLSIVLVLMAALPFTKIGFENLIRILYPAFGVVSLIYIVCLIKLYIKSRGDKAP